MARAIDKNNKRERKRERERGSVPLQILQISFSDVPHKYKSLVKRIPTDVTDRVLHAVIPFKFLEIFRT